MIKTIVTVSIWAFISWLIGLWLGEASGWALFSIGLLLMVWASALQLSRIARWVKNINDPPPATVGPWDSVLAPIYRKLKQNRTDISKLRNSVKNMLRAADALPDGALTLNTEMELTWCNDIARQHLGLKPKVDRGHSIFNVLRIPEFARYTRQSSWPAPILVQVHNGIQPRSLLLQLSRYGQGQLLLVTRDVTQVERLETMRKDFVANVSHELRTPLTVLSGFLETIQDNSNNLDSEQQQHYLGLMHEQALRMQATVSDLLTLAALESTPHINGKPTNVAKIINDSLRQAKIISNGDHKFHSHIDENLLITGSDTELSSAISNLINNAVHYTTQGGDITVTWELEADGSARFSVKDSGIGIASHDIPRLTERFYRVDRGRSRASGGTGLGLAITRHVALRHNAELIINSRLGAGSEFSLYFPQSRVSLQ